MVMLVIMAAPAIIIMMMSAFFRRFDKYICLNGCQNGQQEDRNKGKIGIFHIDIFC